MSVIEKNSRFSSRNMEMAAKGSSGLNIVHKKTATTPRLRGARVCWVKTSF